MRRRRNRAPRLWPVFLFQAGLLAAQDAPLEPGAESLPDASPLRDEPLVVDENLEIVRSHIKELDASGVRNFLVVDPTLVRLNFVSEGNRLYAYGLALGSTYVHLWTSEGRRTIRVTVVPSSRKKPGDVPRGEGFKVRHSLRSDRQIVDYDTLPGSLSTRLDAYDFSMDGKTRFGQNRTAFRVTDQTRRGGYLSRAQTQFRGPAGEFSAGDVGVFLSQVTIPFLSFQGAHWRSPRSGRVSLDLLGGDAHRSWWGRPPLLFQQEQLPFAAYRAGLSVSKTAEIYAVGSRAFEDRFPDRRANDGAGVRWRDGPWGARAEGARSAAGGDALYADVEHNRKFWSALFAVSNAAKDYAIVSGPSGEQGVRSQRGQVRVFDLDSLRLLDLRYNQYRNRVLTSNSAPFALNRDFRGQLRLAGGRLELAQEAAVENLPGVLSPRRTGFYRTRLYRTDPEKEWEPYLLFRRQYEMFPESPSQGYAEHGQGLGGTLRRDSALAVGGAAEHVRSRRLSTGEEKTFINLFGEVRGRWERERSPFTPSAGLDYRRSTERFSSDTRTFGGHLRGDYKFSEDLRFFALGRYERRRSRTSSSTVEIRTGVDWSHALGVFKLRPRRLTGYVFKDLNGDGLRQENEPGVPGARLVLNGQHEAVTDESGRYGFRPRRGNLSVRLDMDTLPGEARLSTSNPQVFYEGENGSPIAWFGVAHGGEIEAGVFVDVDEDGVLSEGDKPISGVSLVLNGERAERTDDQGQARFSGVAPGAHRFQLDVLTLPADTVSLSSTSFSLSLGEGQRRRYIFFVAPLRSASGVVFWDKNGDGRRDAGEPGVPGIVVTAGGRSSRTDAEGAFFLDLPKARAELALDPKSLGSRWKTQAQPPPLQADGDEPFIRRDLDIPLRRTE